MKSAVSTSRLSSGASARSAMTSADAVPAQQLVDRLLEPRLMPELERMPEGRRQRRERLREPLVVAVERRRQLPEHRPELGRADQRSQPREERVEVRRQVREPLHVGQVAARLDGEDEAGRRARPPTARRHRASAAGRRSRSPRRCRSARRRSRATRARRAGAGRRRRLASGRSSSLSSRCGSRLSSAPRGDNRLGRGEAQHEPLRQSAPAPR